MPVPSWLRPHFDPCGGQLRFDRFMELALHAPDHGYYAHSISSVGPTADFATTPTLSATLGRALAQWIRNHRARTVIEVGAGTGCLAQAIRRHLPLLNRTRLRYHIVESSPVLRTAQQDLLGARVTWHEDLPAALRATHGDALLLSNELVDAFPVRVFQATSTPDSFLELSLRLTADHLTEVWTNATDLPDSSVFTHSWQAGQRLEVHESYHHWWRDWRSHWNRGSLLTIDYGGSSSEIYHRHPTGTLRSYLFHQCGTGAAVYDHVGRQDLTADVNFDDLVRWGESLGLHTLSRQTQADFLRPHAQTTHPDHFLTDPHGAGAAFKVLIQEIR